MAFGYQHVQSEIDSNDVLFAMPMRDLYVMFNDGDPNGSIFIDKNVCEEPLQKIAAFLGIPFQFSSNAISGVYIDDFQFEFVAIKERLLAQLARSCTENGQGYLPVPLNTRSKMHISAVTYVWLGFLCLHGMESWSACKSGAHILHSINQVGRRTTTGCDLSEKHSADPTLHDLSLESSAVGASVSRRKKRAGEGVMVQKWFT